MKITKMEKIKAVEHIVYEFVMFRRTSQFLLTNIQDQLLLNIVLESFSIHSRNLFDFFYKKRVKPDDIIASDYLKFKARFRSEKSKKNSLDIICKKANKQVSHLTYTRNNYNRRTKGWNVIKIKPAMETTIKAFLSCLGTQERTWFNEEFRKYNVDSLYFP